ncbi:adhesin [Bacillus thuringiensis]|uniref:iron-sulfur cluster biosynthesis family protein n=1 Tax=Bacillus cereus group TaxID=86661 RepID=UPI000BF459B6|nr:MULTISPECIES: iron-sulfur cluster biosynthesis family protein [Bacillus cereus group]PET30278.1 adhesin [Bacillus anthracis]MDZ4438905.1 iron-sulfur cluster biosynthesis family protein [Bacillus cereus]MED3483038.1 iron-sulfur cluster biosynthesis family protein [Bacillus toyonensis]PEY62718.1 adhesin [Bacillus thuringiensis]PFA11279.1 adhesin [Bacillus thuringiensis]
MQINVTVTEAAIKHFESLETKYPNHFRFLQYEMGGCGRPLDGVVRIQLIKSDVGFEEIQTNWKSFYINKASLAFLDDNLTIDFFEGFQIRSSSQTYSHNIPLEIEK